MSAFEHHHLTAEDRAALRARIDAVLRQQLGERKHTHRECHGCQRFLHRSEFLGPDLLCHLCRALDAMGEA